MIYIGVDPGIREAAYVVLSEDGRLLHFRAPKVNKKHNWFEAAEIHVEHLMVCVRSGNVKAVFFEGYAYGSHSRNRMGADQQKELVGVLKFSLMANGIMSIYPLTPSTVKKRFTGNGRADKGQMIREAIDRGFPKLDQHTVDAYAVCLTGIEMINNGEIEL